MCSDSDIISGDTKLVSSPLSSPVLVLYWYTIHTYKDGHTPILNSTAILYLVLRDSKSTSAISGFSSIKT